MARRKRKKSSFKKICWIFVVFIISGISAYLYFSFPDIESLKRHNPKKTAFMEYREREWKRQGKKYRVQQRWVPISQISPYLIKAVLIAEDDKFWSHEGFDYEAMQKAMEKDIKAGKFKAGGSTISQQLAKNLYLTPSKNPLRKIEEAVITWRMEKILSKKRILELYLNVAEWGDMGIFGIDVAAGHYYGKSASSLTADESARLASVLPNPRRYNPLGDSKYVVNRSNLIYNIMIKRGIVVPQYEEVLENGSKDTASPNLSETRQTPAQ